jgi:phosphate transport system ATP-binding protein
MLSGGQQQRLTIARALSQDPDLLMLDEFSIAVDPVTTMRIEDVLKELKNELTIILVTNLVQQARRLADRTAFFLDGKCVDVGVTEDLFTGEVSDQRTRDYVEGRFG